MKFHRVGQHLKSWRQFPEDPRGERVNLFWHHSAPVSFTCWLKPQWVHHLLSHLMAGTAAASCADLREQWVDQAAEMTESPRPSEAYVHREKEKICCSWVTVLNAQPTSSFGGHGSFRLFFLVVFVMASSSKFLNCYLWSRYLYIRVSQALSFNQSIVVCIAEVWKKILRELFFTILMH